MPSFDAFEQLASACSSAMPLCEAPAEGLTLVPCAAQAPG